MAAIHKLFGRDRVYDAITQHLRGTKRDGSKIKFNCPMCVNMGTTPDKRMRGALWAEDGVGVSCFNCGFKTKFKMGDCLSNKMKSFLREIGVSSNEIAKLNYWAFELHSFSSSGGDATDITISKNIPHFEDRGLPDGSKSLQQWAAEYCTEPDFINAVEYLYSRGELLAEATTYYWTPNTKFNMNQRIIVPCFFEGRIVGYNARAINDNIKPKYHKDIPHDFLFNPDALLNPNRKIVILVEGTFDALAIDAVGIQRAEINEKQLSWIEETGKRVIVLPDRDKDGKKMIEIALKHQWEVSFPRPLRIGSMHGWWDSHIKDAADAVKNYGKIYTLRSILETATDNKMKIQVMLKGFE